MRIKFLGWVLVAISVGLVIDQTWGQGRGRGGESRSGGEARSSGGGSGRSSFSGGRSSGGDSGRSFSSGRSSGGDFSARSFSGGRSSAGDNSARSFSGGRSSSGDVGRSFSGRSFDSDAGKSSGSRSFSTPSRGRSSISETVPRITQPQTRSFNRDGVPSGSRSVEVPSRTLQPRSFESRGDSRTAQPRLTIPSTGSRSTFSNSPPTNSGSRQSVQSVRPGNDAAAKAIRDAQTVRSPKIEDRRQQLSNRVRLPDGRPLSSVRAEQLEKLGIGTSQPKMETDRNVDIGTSRPPRDLSLGGDRQPSISTGPSRLGNIRLPQTDRTEGASAGNRLDGAKPNGSRLDGTLQSGNRLDGIRLPNNDMSRPQRPIFENPVVNDGKENVRGGRDPKAVVGSERRRPQQLIGDAASLEERARSQRDLLRIPGGGNFEKHGDRGPHASFKPVSKRPVLDDAVAAKLSRQNWVERTDRGRIDRLTQLDDLKRVRFDDQYRLHRHGDVARQLNVHRHFIDHGGWQHRHVGVVSPWYRNTAFYRSYWGPSWYPRNCWYPLWRPWVSWSWNFNCRPWFDPRPIWCRPVFFDPCPTWTWWQYPVWQPLPVVASGTWVDVPQVVVEQGFDVQLLAVRFVDPGFAEQNLGPRYRVWLRNNSNRAIDQPFDVVVMGANERNIGQRRVEIGQRVTKLDAGETIALDLRLPLTENNAGGKPFEFSLLHVLVDAGKALNDSDMTNNGAVLDRGEILPVDPYVFDAENPVVESGGIVNVAAEGIGPEPGQVVLHAGGKTYQPEILGWYDLGLRVRLPEIPAADLVDADLVVIRGDGTAANPLNLQIAPRVAGKVF